MTNFINLNLKVNTQATMTQSLIAVGFIEDLQTGALYHPAASLQLLPPGMITRPTGELDAAGLPVHEPVPGYHANVRTESAELAIALEPLAVYPKTPSYVWA